MNALNAGTAAALRGAHAADSRGRADTGDPFVAERAFQAEWLANRLGLD